jgi:hypothetical protein
LRIVSHRWSSLVHYGSLAPTELLERQLGRFGSLKKCVCSKCFGVLIACKSLSVLAFLVPLNDLAAMDISPINASYGIFCIQDGD